MRGSSGKVNLARGPASRVHAGRDGSRTCSGDIAIAPSIDYLERAYDQAKYGDFSERPYLNVVIPSLVDPSVAPPGQARGVSCFVQYAPYNIKEGRGELAQRREAFGDAVVDTLEEYCPGFKETRSSSPPGADTPWDLEQDFGLTEGNIFHGELSPGAAALPAPGSRLGPLPHAGAEALDVRFSGTHPGGGVMGGPGELAAKTMLESGV